MKENPQIKEELFSLYKNIKNNISNDKLPTNNIKIIENSNGVDSISLIAYIKELIQMLLNSQKSVYNSGNTKNNNNNNLNMELNNNNIKKEDYIQLENQIIKLENDNKYYLKNFLQYKIQKDVLEMKLNAYMSLEDEYEELKEKVKYEGGKFLDNDRKDNEIIIIRRENSVLKKEIVKLENINKSNENKNKEYQKKIKDLQINIDNLNKKIYNFEIIIKESNIKNGNIHFDRTNSCLDLRKINHENTLDKFENSHKIKTLNNYNKIKNIKSIYPHSLNFKNKRLINFNSPKNDIFMNNNKTTNTINSNLLNNKNNKISFKNEINTLKNLKNNSITIIKVEKDESKSLSVNKKNLERNNHNNIVYKYTNNKIKTFNKILNLKTKCVSPLSCKNSKNTGKIITKYIQRDVHKKINNNLSQNIRANSNKH